MTDASSDDMIKRREIGFMGPQATDEQAQGACNFLIEIPGVQETRVLGDGMMEAVYDLRQVCLEYLEALLISEGFHLDNSLITKVKRAFYYYSEDTQRTNLQLGDECRERVRKVAARNFQQNRQPLHDPRPQAWRRYL